MEADHWKRARAVVAAQLAANPGDAEALTNMSIIEESFEHLESARSYAEKAVAKSPNSSDAHAQLARANAVLAATVPVWKQVGLLRTMHKELELAYKYNPKNVEAFLLETVFTFRAPSLVGGGKTKAYSIANRLKEVDPDWGHLADARLAQLEDDEPAAIRAVNQVSPANYRAKAILARIYCCLSKHPQFDQAFAVANQLQKMDSTRAVVYEVKATYFASRGAFAELDSLLSESQHLVPDDLSAYYWAARTLMRLQKDPARAESYLRKYLSAEPEGRAPSKAEARWTLGLVLSQLGRKDEAVNELKQAVQMKPDLDEAKKDLRRLSD